MAVEIRYYVDFQYLPKGAARPLDQGVTMELEATHREGNLVLPGVGDFVNLDTSFHKGEYASFHCRVRSRLFHFTKGRDDVPTACNVNIVVEETDDDWGLLIKE